MGQKDRKKNKGKAIKETSNPDNEEEDNIVQTIVLGIAFACGFYFLFNFRKFFSSFSSSDIPLWENLVRFGLVFVCCWMFVFFIMKLVSFCLKVSKASKKKK